MGDASYTPQIYYVREYASGANNGTSWTDAYTDLQSALAAASSGDEIWVADGTYKPTTGTDRTISFSLKNGVNVYGGFSGTETSLVQRHGSVPRYTVLSRDIGTEGDNSDNSYHVVSNINIDNTALLDGFAIVGIDTIGVYRGNTFYLRNTNTTGYADLTFPFGNSGYIPIAGNWDGQP